MSYNKTTWVGGAAGGRFKPGATAITPDRLNNIEAGIENALAVAASGSIQLGGTTGPTITSGAGSPEGVVTAIIGSLYTRTDGGGVALYVKQSGAGNTGWVALAGTTPDPYEPPVPTDVPISEYGFNEGSGTTTYDLSGGGRNLTASNPSTSWTTPGHSGSSAKTKFTASAVGPSGTATDYTIMMWVSRTGTWSGFSALFKNITQNLWIEENSARDYAISIYSDGAFAMSRTLTAIGTWYHVACTRDSTGLVQIYVDGLLEGTAVGSGSGVDFGSGGTFMVCDDGVESGHVAFGGTVDDLRIFNSVLPREQIVLWKDIDLGTEVTPVPPASGGSWLSGASYIGYPGSDAFGTFRGTATQIAGTWMNDTSLPTIQPGAEYGSWTAPMDIGLSPPTWNGWAAEAQGANDSFWNAAFTTMNTLRSGKGTTYVRPWYEFNGTWMPWTVSSAADITNFKLAWNRIAAIARSKFPAVKICVGAAAANGVSVASCWPTATVDALSIDFYNNYPFVTTQGGFDSKIVNAAGSNSLELLRQLAYSKGVPVIISEWANAGIDTGGGAGGGESTAFIDAMYDWLNNNKGTGAGQVVGDVYFNGWPQFRLYNVEGGASIGSTAQPTTAARYALKF